MEISDALRTVGQHFRHDQFISGIYLSAQDINMQNISRPSI